MSKEIIIKRSVYSSKITDKDLEGLGFENLGEIHGVQKYNLDIDRQNGKYISISRFHKNTILVEYCEKMEVIKALKNTFSNFGHFIYVLSVLGIEFE